MLDIACGKSGYSSALLNVNLKFHFLECRISQGGGVWDLCSRQMIYTLSFWMSHLKNVYLLCK